MAAEIITVDRQKRVMLLDCLTIVAPLGLRFHDTMTGEVVRDGLAIWAYPINRPRARRRLIANRRGIYVLHDAPGLRDLQHGTGDDDYWKNLPPKQDFVIEVSDEQFRFIPFQFVAELPARGIYEWTGSIATSPPSTMRSVPLYSSPSRTPPAGIAVVRADLWDPSGGNAGVKAAAAVLELYDNEQMVARGISDQEGKIALLFPYPAPRSFAVISPPGSPLSSPPVATRPALTEQLWTFQVRAFYSPLQSPPPTSTEDSLPDLRSALSQPEARLWADEARTEELREVAVQFGQPQPLRSTPSSMSPPETKGGSMLFITPAV